MDAIKMIELFGNLFYVSLAVAVVGLGLAVFFFFYFDIPTVYALMTGKAKEDTIRRMAEQNAKTGNLRHQYLHTGPTGRTGKTKHTGKTGGLTQNMAPAQPQVVQPPAAEQTAPVAQPERYETSVLQTPVEETSILREEVYETQVLGYADTQTGETAMLTNATYAAQAAAPQQMPYGFHFNVTESTMVIHTNEMI